MKVSFVIACLALVASGPLRAEKILFESSVAPILKQRCETCHSPEKRKGELDLSSAEGVFKGGETGPVFKAGDSEHSLLYELVHKGEMPKKGDPLSHGEVATIRKWIEQGAHFTKPPQVASTEMNQHDILPITLLRCTACHGRKLRENGLDMRTVAGMKKGGKSGPALVPGNPEGSLMIQRIKSEACPPKAKLLKYFVRRPPQSELVTLKKWITAGAPVVDLKPDIATTEPDPLVSEEDRQHWSFQSPKKPSVGDSVDFFIKRKLSESDLSFSQEADRDVLIRRAFLDLLGLPPSVGDWKKWRESSSSDWFALMIDELLESPHYGERWGRYWLDLAGYADSEGGVSSDPLRKVAWKYRDYVIAAFNNDKPYNRFLLEQLAGDELVDYANAPEITEEIVDNLVATGFLRMGIDQTGSRTMNYVEERLGVTSDVLSVVGSGVMGLTMECVRCHTHKYDPIPQRDYYRLKAVFQGALDEHDWLTFKNRSLSVGTARQKKLVAQVNPPLASEQKRLEALRRKKVMEWQREMLRQHYPDQSKEDREATFPALRRADNQRSLRQRNLVEKLQVALVIPNEQQPGPVQKAKAEIDALERQMDRNQSKMVPPLAIRALWDRGQPSPTYILRRGEHLRAGRLVGPGVPSALTDGKTPFDVKPPFPGGTSKTGRRLAFANWVTQADHPLTARVIVNRVWHHHFGMGIVKTLENFGLQGERPTHPELLDWLALEFVEKGWSIKELHRIMMNSQAYRQASFITEDVLTSDPQNRLLARMPIRRMDAEALRDSLLFISGRLDDTPGGYPDGVTVNQDGFVNVKRTPRGGWRRSVYVQYRRTEIPSMMDTFDYPEMGPNCISRTISTVSPQSLMLMNNDRVRELANAFASRIEKEVPGGNPRSIVKNVYHLALSRDPSDEEMKLGISTLTELENAWPENSSGAVEAYCHTIVNSAAFIYVD